MATFRKTSSVSVWSIEWTTLASLLLIVAVSDALCFRWRDSLMKSLEGRGWCATCKPWSIQGLFVSVARSRSWLLLLIFHGGGLL